MKLTIFDDFFWKWASSVYSMCCCPTQKRTQSWNVVKNSTKKWIVSRFNEIIYTTQNSLILLLLPFIYSMIFNLTPTINSLILICSYFICWNNFNIWLSFFNIAVASAYKIHWSHVHAHRFLMCDKKLKTCQDLNQC